MRLEWDGFWQKRKSKTTDSWSKKRIINVLDKYIKEGQSVLDAGCGSGYFSSYFISKNYKVYSLDFSKEALKLTEKTTRKRCAEYIEGDLLDEQLAGHFANRFDVIFSDGLFEHYAKDDQQLIINNFKDMKKEDGIIITFVPNRHSFWRFLRPIFMHGIKERPLLLVDLISLMEENDLRIVKTGGINVLPLKYSPESLGKAAGMLIYCISR